MCQSAVGAMAPLFCRAGSHDDVLATEPFALRYVVASSMYGKLDLPEILPEVHRCGASHIDLWPAPHGRQREQLDDLGEAAFEELLQQHDVQLSCLTQYPLGPFGLADELQLARRLRCPMIVTGGKGPAGLSGPDLKSAISRFVEQLRPHLAVAEECGVTIAIENHSSGLLESPDALRWLHELAPASGPGIAFAPYHLPQDAGLLAGLIRDLGNRIRMFYAWQHGDGCMKPLPKEREFLQLPGRGPLDFRPLLAALADVQYSGWTEIFMHPFPRGIPIQPTAAGVTAEISQARKYLDDMLPVR
jgi:sugar phosphate isomerase/epimerase